MQIQAQARKAPHREMASQTQEAEAPPAILLIDTRGSIVRLNSAGLKMLGCGEDEALGVFYGRFLSLTDAVPDRQGWTSYSDPIVRCLATEQLCLSVVGLVHARNGLCHIFEGTVVPTYSEKCRVQGAVLIVRSEEAARASLSLSS